MNRQLQTALKRGSSSVGRAIAFQAIGREFEPRLPLKRMSDFGTSISDLKNDDRTGCLKRRKSEIEHPNSEIKKSADVAQG